MPVGWEQLQVPGKDQHYFFNPMTNERQWDDPRMVDGLNPQAVMSRAYQPFGLQPPDITRVRDPANVPGLEGGRVEGGMFLRTADRQSRCGLAPHPYTWCRDPATRRLAGTCF